MRFMKTTITDHNDLLDAMGGTFAVAAWAGLGPSAVSVWRAVGIPKSWHLRIALEARRRKLRVDYVRVFGIEPELLQGLKVSDPLASAA